MIEVCQLTKSYRIRNGRHYVFRDVSASFPEGANIGIMGPNGGGKSTFLRILGGIDYPDSGRVLTQSSFSWPLGLQGGFVSHLTGRENCRMVSNLYGVHPRDIGAHLDQIKELAGIGTYFEEPFHTYSSGMASRVGFALSMSFDFDYFLIDEITSVGDAAFKRLAKQALEAKAARSKVIMVSHNLSDLHKFCDIGVVLEDGALTVYETVDEAIRAYLPRESASAPDPQERTRIVSIDSLSLEATDAPPELETLTQSIEKTLASMEWQLEQPKHTISGEDSEFYSDLGSIYMRIGNFPKAQTYHERAIQENRFLLRSLTALCNLAERTQNYLGYEAHLEAAESIDDSHVGVRMARLRLLFREGDHEAALELVEDILERHSKHAASWHLKAKALFLSGDAEAALQAQIKAIEHGQSDPIYAGEVPGYYQQLSQILAALGLIETSGQAHYKAFELPKQNPIKRFREIHEALQVLEEKISL